MKDKKNDHIYNDKQHHYCKECGCRFVQCSEQSLLSAETRALIERVLLKRLSLGGICHAVEIGLKGLLGILVGRYAALPDHVHVEPVAYTHGVTVHPREA